MRKSFCQKFKFILIMKKTIKLMAFVVIAAIGCTASLHALSSNSEDKPSAMILANVEALSEWENGQECKWEYKTDNFGCPYHKCVPGGNGYLCHCGDEVH